MALMQMEKLIAEKSENYERLYDYENTSQPLRAERADREVEHCQRKEKAERTKSFPKQCDTGNTKCPAQKQSQHSAWRFWKK